MLKLFIKTIKEKWVFLVVLCAISVLTIWMYVSLFPTVSKQSADYEKLLSQFPKEMWEIFGMKGGNFAMTTLEQFLSVEMFSLMWPIMAIILFVNFGIAAIAGEIEKGTIEILLALPVSRVKLFISKYLAGALMVLAFCFVSIMCIIPMAWMYHIDYQMIVYTKLFIVGSFFALAGFSLSMMCSSIFEKGRSSAIVFFSYLIMYILNILSTLKSSLKNLQYISFFHYVDMSNVLSTNTIDIHGIIVFGCVIIAAFLIGIVYFNRRDVTV